MFYANTAHTTHTNKDYFPLGENFSLWQTQVSRVLILLLEVVLLFPDCLPFRF